MGKKLPAPGRYTAIVVGYKVDQRQGSRSLVLDLLLVDDDGVVIYYRHRLYVHHASGWLQERDLRIYKEIAHAVGSKNPTKAASLLGGAFMVTVQLSKSGDKVYPHLTGISNVRDHARVLSRITDVSQMALRMAREGERPRIYAPSSLVQRWVAHVLRQEAGGPVVTILPPEISPTSYDAAPLFRGFPEGDNAVSDVVVVLYADLFDSRSVRAFLHRNPAALPIFVCSGSRFADGAPVVGYNAVCGATLDCCPPAVWFASGYGAFPVLFDKAACSESAKQVADFLSKLAAAGRELVFVGGGDTEVASLFSAKHGPPRVVSPQQAAAVASDVVVLCDQVPEHLLPALFEGANAPPGGRVVINLNRHRTRLETLMPLRTCLYSPSWRICPSCGAAYLDEGGCLCGGANPGRVFDVASTVISLHRKHDDPEKVSVRVTYNLKSFPVGSISEWLKFGAKNYAGRVAEEWWRAHTDAPVPQSPRAALDEISSLLARKQWRGVKRVEAVKERGEGGFWRVVAREHRGAEEDQFVTVCDSNYAGGDTLPPYTTPVAQVYVPPAD